VLASTPLPSAPAWAPESELAPSGALAVVTNESETTTLAVQFSPISGATGYLAEIAHDASFHDIVARREIAAAGSVVETPRVGPGRYYARVRARGRDGLPGRAGPTRELRVVRLALPPGATAEQTKFTLPAERRIAIDDPADLELAFGGKGFSRAPAEFGLAHGEACVMRLRIARARSSLALRLVPRTLQAAIEIGPKTAVWPFDPVDIVVRLEDRGRPVTEHDPKLSVRLNLEDIPVTWHHDGNVWRARVQPRVPPGPWVIRVEATDAYGSELGRGFLEVVGPPSSPNRRVAAR
jgi:hypothetical protein